VLTINYYAGPIKGGKFLHQLREYQLLKINLFVIQNLEKVLIVNVLTSEVPLITQISRFLCLFYMSRHPICLCVSFPLLKTCGSTERLCC
jgi:hypothetical protein